MTILPVRDADTIETAMFRTINDVEVDLGAIPLLPVAIIKPVRVREAIIDLEMVEKGIMARVDGVLEINARAVGRAARLRIEQVVDRMGGNTARLGALR